MPSIPLAARARPWAIGRGGLTSNPVVAHLHFLPRGRIVNHFARAELLANESFVDGDTAGRLRTAEMFTPTLDNVCADMATDSWNMAEVVTAIHDAETIHVHSLGVDLALSLLPYVRPEALKDKCMVVHGPSAQRSRNAKPDATRLTSWPGPVALDPWAERLLSRWVDAELKATTDASHEGQDDGEPGARAKQRLSTAFDGELREAPHTVWIDPSLAEMLPSCYGPRPLAASVDAEGKSRGPVVMVSLSAALPAGLRERMRNELPKHWQTWAGDELVLEIFDEAQLPRARSQRRVCQLCICADAQDEALFEACCQGVPVLALKSVAEEAALGLVPPAILECSAVEDENEAPIRGEHEAEEEYQARLRARLDAAQLDVILEQMPAFVERWRAGQAVHNDCGRARQWLLERCYSL